MGTTDEELLNELTAVLIGILRKVPNNLAHAPSEILMLGDPFETIEAAFSKSKKDGAEGVWRGDVADATANQPQCYNFGPVEVVTNNVEDVGMPNETQVRRRDAVRYGLRPEGRAELHRGMFFSSRIAGEQMLEERCTAYDHSTMTTVRTPSR